MHQVIGVVYEPMLAGVDNRDRLFRDLSNKLQDTLDFIEESMDVTLAKLCSYFNSHTYQRLLNAYHLLGKSLTSMDQLQMHFVNVVQTRTLDILTTTSGAGRNEQNLSTYTDLCKVSDGVERLRGLMFLHCEDG